jgi:cardiolipin synthase
VAGPTVLRSGGHVFHALKHAQRSIWIANAYFIPDRALIRELSAAAKRWVDVRVIVSGESDVKAVQWAGEATYAKLLEEGVRIYRFQDTHMHAKTMVIDGVWSVIGSHNLDYVSLFLNRELILEVLGPRTGEAMRAMFERDIARCTEIEARTWNARPLTDKWIQQLAYRFRRWL